MLPGPRTPRDAIHLLRLTAEAFIASLRQNAGMGLLAVGLSTSIWLFITNEQNPPRTGTLPFRVAVQPVNVPETLDVLRPMDPVTVRITAPIDQWPGLTEESFQATADLSGLPEGSSSVPVNVRARDPRVRVLEWIPGQVTVELDRLQRQVVPVHVNVLQGPPVGFSSDPGKVKPQVNQVEVLGPERLISTVDAAVVDINLSSARTSIRQSYPLVPRTARGYDISGVRLEPQSIVVEVPVERQIDYVTIPVVAEIQGQPARGFWVSEVQVKPSTVAAIGPQDVLTTLGTLRTLPVDVSNLSGSASRTVGLSLPNGVTLLNQNRNTVQVDVTVRPVGGTRPVLAAPQFRGLGEGLEARTDGASVELVVSGEGPPLLDLSPARVAVVVDLEGRGPGTYEVEPRVELPPGLTLVSVTPARLQVTIQAQDTPG